MPTNEYVYDTYRKLSQEDTNAINNALQSGKVVRSIQGRGTYINGQKAQNTADDYMKTIVGDNNYSFYNGVLHSNGDVSNVEGAIQVTPEYIADVAAGVKTAPNPTGNAVTTGDKKKEAPGKTIKTTGSSNS
ncbi:MAG: hypothetical protein II503_02045 [Clostridia bacterium]|nr:hypothetical protein [Clostridia bacterium]